MVGAAVRATFKLIWRKPIGNDGPEVDVYSCGCPEMVAEVRAQLLQRGFDEDAIIHEKY